MQRKWRRRIHGARRPVNGSNNRQAQAVAVLPTSGHLPQGEPDDGDVWRDERGDLQRAIFGAGQ